MSSSSSSSSKIKLIQYPSCKICFKNYDQTINKPCAILPCCHTFCSECIDCLQDKKCPTCRVIIQDKCINWELQQLLPEDLIANDLTHFKFENEPNKIILHEVIKSKEEIDEIIKINIKTNLDRINNFKDDLNMKTEELINKIVFNQKLITERMKNIENCFNLRVKNVLNEKDLALANLNQIDNDDKISIDDLNEMKINSKILKKSVKSLKQICADFESELDVIETHDHFTNLVSIKKDKVEEELNEDYSQVIVNNNGMYNYLLKSDETNGLGITLDEKSFIKSVDFDSPGYRAGLRENFKIAEINGILTNNIAYYEILKLFKNNRSKISLSVIKYKRVLIKIPNYLQSFGLSIALLKENNCKKIVKIDQNSPAELYGLKESDIIFEINGIKVKHFEMNQIKQILNVSLRKREVEFLILNNKDYYMLSSDGYNFD